MKIRITGHTEENPRIPMWYRDRIGEVFEVTEDDYGYLTVEPIWKNHKGHIKRVDCQVIEESSDPRAKIAKARFERIVDESAAFGISCPSGKCDY